MRLIDHFMPYCIMFIMLSFAVGGFCVVTFGLFVSTAYAQVKFTEVYPAPDKGAFEWVEMYNDSSDPVDLKKYSIFDTNGNNVILNGLILAPYSYSIATSSSVINNTGDTLFLKDDTNTIVNTVTTPKDLTSAQSYALCDDGWRVTDKISKNETNTLACYSAPTNTPSPTAILTPSPVISRSSFYSNIYISEALPYPEKNASEWLEIVNQNSFEVNLANWQIDDAEGGSSRQKISTTIPANSYKRIFLENSMLNNDGDDIRLLDTQNEVVDGVSYVFPQQGQSVSRASFISESMCITTPTPNEANEACPISLQTDLQNSNADTSATDPIPSVLPEIFYTSPSNTPIHVNTQSIFSVTRQSSTVPTPTPAAYSGSIYSLNKRQPPQFYTYAQIGSCFSFLSCALNFMYSMYRYKYVYT